MNEKLVSEYFTAVSQNQQRLYKLSQNVRNSTAEVEPGDITYAHLADMNHTAEMLDEIMRFMGISTE